MSSRDLASLARAFADIALDAGVAIMDVYRGDFAVQRKDDASPVTEADLRADAIIVPALGQLLPGVRVISEERFADAPLELDVCFLLVDPLDGTREFVSRNGEFTVNIALVHEGVPLAACVFAPAVQRLYLGAGPGQAWAADAAPGTRFTSLALAPLRTREPPAQGLTALASRSHRDADTDAWLGMHPVAQTLSAGSSLKFCRLAEGRADVYPRFGPTMEWDTAAGDGVLRAAGGAVLTPSGEALRYGKTALGLRNGAFVAWGRAPAPGD